VCEKEPTDALEYMTAQQREDLTASAQVLHLALSSLIAFIFLSFCLVWKPRLYSSCLPAVQLDAVVVCHPALITITFCSLAVLDPRVGHTMDILYPFFQYDL